MRYVIVSIVKGPAGDFNNNLRKDIKLNLLNYLHILQ